jgi:hypothetical protein
MESGEADLDAMLALFEEGQKVGEGVHGQTQRGCEKICQIAENGAAADRFAVELERSVGHPNRSLRFVVSVRRNNTGRPKAGRMGDGRHGFRGS